MKTIIIEMVFVILGFSASWHKTMLRTKLKSLYTFEKNKIETISRFDYYLIHNYQQFLLKYIYITSVITKDYLSIKSSFFRWRVAFSF
jgi:hypothetical protein